jgi:GNAT superfamily N-acetyltransferase
MEVRHLDPDDDGAFDAWYAVLQRTDRERWPELGGWTRREVHSLATRQGSATYVCMGAWEGETLLGITLCELPASDNRDSVYFDVRVLPGSRRRGVGTSLMAGVEALARAEQRSVLHVFCEVPMQQLAGHPSVPFAERLGFRSVQTGLRRHLELPLDEGRRSGVAREVADAAAGYQIESFTAPWPEDAIEDQCELHRRMSTDMPSGEATLEEEVWDAARVAEQAALLAEQEITKLVAVARDGESGRLVAFTELALPADHPAEGWQWSTLVLREHRGHRLGLAVKLANLDVLADVAPAVGVVITGNAQENWPMVAINDRLGFVVAASSTHWQKELSA